MEINIHTLTKQEYGNLERTNQQLVDMVRETIRELEDINAIEENGWEAEVQDEKLTKILEDKDLEALKEYYGEISYSQGISDISDINVSAWTSSVDRYWVTGIRDMIAKSYDGFKVSIAIGGPGEYLDTEKNEVVGTWGSSRVYGVLDSEISEKIEDALLALYQD